MAAPTDADLLALATLLARRLIASDRTLVTAESCTGGWIAKICTDLPGSSRWYLGGIVSYADAAKSDVLGVPASLLQRHGAVSEPVVRAMAQGALQRLGGESSVAVSGIAGPDGGTPEKPVGTVWLAVASPRGVSTKHLTWPGSRDQVRTLASWWALSMVREAIRG